MELGTFSPVLRSIANLGGFTIEGWSPEGCIFTSAGNDREQRQKRETREFSTTVMRDNRFRHFISREGQAYYGLPLSDQACVVGALICHHPARLAATGSTGGEVARMETFLNEMCNVIQNDWSCLKEIEDLSESVSSHFEDLSLYARTTRRFRTLSFADNLLQELVREIQDSMRSELAFTLFEDRPDWNSHLATAEIAKIVPDCGHLARDLVAAIPPDAPSLRDNYYIVNDSQQDPAFDPLHLQPFRCLLVAIRTREQFYGWLGLVSFNMKEIFRRGELSLLISISQQLAITISNRDLYHDLEQFVINVVKSLAYAIEAKHPYTRGHSERVNHLSMLMAERMGLDQETKSNLNWASVLHDVGKIGIPGEILNKPGRLNEEEYAEIKTHPNKGYTILKPLKPLTASLPGILHHHEHFDGAGYPDGLTGEAIPLSARIIAVADTFDAINSSRAYRPAKSAHKAMQIITKVAGTQLDAAVVDHFTAIFKEYKLGGDV